MDIPRPRIYLQNIRSRCIPAQLCRRHHSRSGQLARHRAVLQRGGQVRKLQQRDYCCQRQPLRRYGYGQPRNHPHRLRLRRSQRHHQRYYHHLRRLLPADELHVQKLHDQRIERGEQCAVGRSVCNRCTRHGRHNRADHSRWRQLQTLRTGPRIWSDYRCRRTLKFDRRRIVHNQQYR